MNWRDLQWKRAGAPLDEEDLRRLELELGVVFPSSYRECAKIFHGATPTPRDFELTDQRHGRMGSCFSLLLEVAEGGDETVRQCLEWHAEDLLVGLIPFGADPGGDLMCFDYRSVIKEPPVIYWHHERVGLDSVSFLADSFDGFIDLLH